MENSPNLRRANIFFLIIMILILVFGSLMQAFAPIWGLVGTQVLLLLIPALIFLRLSKLPIKDTIRWRWPGGRLALLSVIMGVAILPFAFWFGDIFIQLFEYTPDLPPAFFPTTIGQAILMFIAIAILAPICEEVVFRGIIQRPYEGFGPWKAIFVVGIFFAIFHLSLIRLFALIPVALLLGYVVWASNSLIPGILLHAAYNAPVVMVTIMSSLRPDLATEGISSLAAAGVSLLGLTIALILFNRYASPSPPPDIPTQTFSLHIVWPVFVILIIFVFTASIEFVYGRFPELLTTRELQLSAAPWEQPKQWQYELQNNLGETVGAAECQMTPGETTYELNCHVEVDAFSAELDHRDYQFKAMTSQRTYSWSSEDLFLIEAEIIRESDFDRLEANLAIIEDQLHLEVRRNDVVVDELHLPPNSLLVDEWPWRLSALPFSISLGSEVTMAWPAYWDTEDQHSIPGYEKTAVIIRGGEPLATPAGNFISWRVTTGQNRIAWYDVEPPHTLLRYDDGILIYLLK